MKKRRFPFTVFVYPRIIGQTPYAMTWKQIREMADAGVDIQSHSFSHPFLTRRRNSSLDDQRYAAWLERELEESKRTLERQTGKPVTFLAYPYGDYDHYLIPNVARAGYDAALTCDFGRVRRNSDPLRMKRVVIDKAMSFASFRRYLGAGSMMLEAMTPPPNQVIDAEPAVIMAKIPNHKNLDPRSVGIALLSMTGTVPYSYDPRDGSVSLTIKDALKGSWQRALVWATDSKTGRRIEAMWSFRLSEPTPADCPPIDVPAAPAVARTGAGGSMRGSGLQRR
jgi:peptidoglycan/xylan/chitin deacetylase (PgdA/CDA1 family)